MIRRELLPTAEGALGCARCGTEGPAVLLLPQSPLGSRQYERVLPALAAAGFRAVALDLMGYGDSDPRRRHWSIEDFAHGMRMAMDALGFERPTLVAGHFAAQASIELAAMHPQRVAALALDGTPLYAAEVRERLRKAPGPPAVADDGSHAAEMWRRMVAFLRQWDPTLDSLRVEANGPALRALHYNFMRTNYEPPVTPAIGAHDTAQRLRSVSCPVLALTADTDSLTRCHETVLELAADVRGHRFAGHHPLQSLDGSDAARWLDVVIPFLQRPRR
jgi:pimeloyl-ACP methyl ester carboxylesterase